MTAKVGPCNASMPGYKCTRTLNPNTCVESLLNSSEFIAYAKTATKFAV